MSLNLKSTAWLTKRLDNAPHRWQRSIFIGGGSYWAGRRPAHFLAPVGRAYLWPANFWAWKQSLKATQSYQFNSIQALKRCNVPIDIVFQLQLQAQNRWISNVVCHFYLLTELVTSVYVALALTVKSALQLFKSMQ